MRHAIGLTFLVALSLPAWAQDKPAEEDEKLYGTWTVTWFELCGQGFQGSGAFIFSKGGKFTQKATGHADDGWTFMVDASRTPRKLDLIDPKGGAMMTIYAINGDTLKIAYESGGKRPTGFDSRQNMVLTLERQKP
jgi:uncharacterized protein (TIGR03067 family)